MKIKVLEKTEGCMPLIFKNGEWIDLFTAEDTYLKAPQANKMHIRNKGKAETPEVRVRDVDFDSKRIPLGVAMALPEGFEAHVVPRSSTFKKYGLMQVNSMGIIDVLFRGNNDEWKMPVVATRSVFIPKGTRLCQFRIQLSQKATAWQKLKWLLSNGIELQKVSSLSDESRGGFGSTGN